MLKMIVIYSIIVSANGVDKKIEGQANIDETSACVETVFLETEKFIQNTRKLIESDFQNTNVQIKDISYKGFCV